MQLRASGASRLLSLLFDLLFVAVRERERDCQIDVWPRRSSLCVSLVPKQWMIRTERISLRKVSFPNICTHTHTCYAPTHTHTNATNKWRLCSDFEFMSDVLPQSAQTRASQRRLVVTRQQLKRRKTMIIIIIITNNSWQKPENDSTEQSLWWMIVALKGSPVHQRTLHRTGR